MPRENPPSFQFYPRDFLASRAVGGMCPEALGGYVRLLCHAWLSDEQGTLPDDDDLLAGLSQLWERWSIHGAAIRRAFAVRATGDGRTLVQQRMVETRNAQIEYAKRAAKGADVTNARRWGSVANESLTSRSGVAKHVASGRTASASASSPATNEATATPARARAVRGAAAAKDSKRRKPEPVTEITPNDIARAVRLTGVSAATATLLAERVKLEGPTRGYQNYPSALLEWCRREAASPLSTNGSAAREKTERRDGDRSNSPAGPLVWWHGSWRSEAEATEYGWRSE